MNICIRCLGPGDGPLLSRAAATLLSAEAGATAEQLEQALAWKHCWFIVALEDSEPVGYLSAFAFPDVINDGLLAYLYDIVVHSDSQQRGIGRRMLEKMKSLCSRDGVRLIWAGTTRDNAAARAFFEKTGAERVGESYCEYEYRI